MRKITPTIDQQWRNLKLKYYLGFILARPRTRSSRASTFERNIETSADVAAEESAYEEASDEEADGTTDEEATWAPS